MPGMVKEIQKDGTYRKYGDAPGEIEIGAIGKRGALARIPFSVISEGESLIVGRFAYAAGNKPISAGHTKTWEYVEEK